MIYGVTEDGFQIKDFSAIVDNTEDEIKKNLGADIDLSDYSALNQILKSFAYELARLWQVTESIHYAGFVNTAAGADLDACVALLGISRLEATAATGAVIFSRAAAATYDITIPAGTVVQTSTGVQYATIAAVTLVAGQTSVSAAIEAVDPGAAGNVAAYAISRIPVTVSGIESVSNVGETVQGSDAETDTALRLRARNYSPGAKATLAAIRSAIMAVTGVTACLITENTTAHTIAATVLGGTDNAVIAAIEASRPAGISCTMGRPTPETVVVTAAIAKAADATAAAVQANVLAALTAYFGGLAIGADVPYSAVASAIMAADGVASLSSLSVACGSTTLSSFGQTLAITDAQIAAQGSHAITVS